MPAIRNMDRVLLDEDLLRLLQDLHIDFASAIDHARHTYETASAEIPDHPDLDPLIADGWMRVVWGRIAAPFTRLRVIDPAGPMAGLRTLMERRHDETFRFSPVISEDPHLAGLAQQIAEAKELPAGTMCQTPEWVAAQLWDRAYAGSTNLMAALRLWTDRWKVLGAPDLVPSKAWAPAAADAFRRTAIDVLESIAGLPDWDRTREHMIASLTLSGSQPRVDIERYIRPPPLTTAGRALWLGDNRLERPLMENLDASGDVAGLMRLLLADVEFQELSPAPNPLAARLLPVIADRPDLLYSSLFTIERHPRLLADLLFCPQTSVLACLLIARWQGLHGAWDKELRSRDFQSAKAHAFADAVSVMGHFLREGTVSSAEVAVCRGCQRTFNALTGTPLARLRQRDRWLTQAQAMEDAASLRETASRCGVALSTAFRWRHRFLQAGQAPPAGFDGIVEADETFVRRSYKGARLWAARKPDAPPAPRPKARRRGVRTGRRGTDLDEQVPVLVVRDRQGTTHSTVLPDLTAASIGGVLLPLLGPEVVLCSDSARAYGVLARSGGLHHEPVNIAAGERMRDGVFHIQNVNAYDSRLKEWMRGWHGVATRYLGSYLAWHRMDDRLGHTSTAQAILLNAL